MRNFAAAIVSFGAVGLPALGAVGAAASDVRVETGQLELWGQPRDFAALIGGDGGGFGSMTREEWWSFWEIDRPIEASSLVWSDKAPMSAAFASTLTGLALTDDVLFSVERMDSQGEVTLSLLLTGAGGPVVSAATWASPLAAQVFSAAGAGALPVAIDEGRGMLYLGDPGAGNALAIVIPAPATAWIAGAVAVAASARRRGGMPTSRGHRTPRC